MEGSEREEKRRKKEEEEDRERASGVSMVGDGFGEEETLK